MRAPDAVFADPRLARLYDFFDDDRGDLDVYDDLVSELGCDTVLDLGCGTGSLAVRLAARGITVIGVDPAGASLDMARTKPHADAVEWVHGDATALSGRDSSCDLVVMTGNVAQVFVDEEDWHTTLAAAASVLRPGGWLVFETRRTEARAWERWTTPPEQVTLPDGRSAVTSRNVTEVDLPLVTFESVLVLDGETLTSTSTLRFRERHQVETDLVGHGFDVSEVRGAPDRPGLELVFLAQRRPPDA